MTLFLLKTSGLKRSHCWYLYQVEVKDRPPLLMRGDGQWSGEASKLCDIASSMNIHACVVKCRGGKAR